MLLIINISSTTVSAAIVERGDVLMSRSYAMAYDEINFSRLIDQLALDFPGPTVVAIATTGYVDKGKVRSVTFNIIPFWDGFDLERLICSRFNCPSVLLNDAQAAAWGEYVIRKNSDPIHHPGNLLFIDLSSGVGGGLILDHRLRTGPHGLAGHIGHTGIRFSPTDNFERCSCGRDGCLEMVASGTALARQASYFFHRPMSVADLFEKANTDEIAEAIISNAALAVAEAIAGVHMIADLTEVVIGGSVGLAEGMLSRVQTSLKTLGVCSSPKITRAILVTDTGFCGMLDWVV